MDLAQGQVMATRTSVGAEQSNELPTCLHRPGWGSKPGLPAQPSPDFNTQPGHLRHFCVSGGVQPTDC